MSTLIDFIPVVAFFIVYKVTNDLFLATAIIIALSLLLTAWTWLTKKKVEKVHLISAGLLLVFGGLTLILGDSDYIMWKPTLLYWLLAVIVLLCQIKGINLTEKTLMAALHKGEADIPEVPDNVWKKLNTSSALFFLAVGGINLYVASYFSEAIWVDFKLFGLTGLTFIYLMYVFARLGRYLNHKD